MSTFRSPLTVTDPVAAMVVAVTEPALVTANPVAVLPSFTWNAYCAVVVPIPTRLFVESTTNVFVSTFRSLLTVADPVVVNVDTVVEPALIVPEVLILPPVTPPVAVIPVNREPSPTNFVPVVIVPFANISLRNRTVVVP